MPSFDGNNLFGFGVSMATLANPAATQRNTFFGLNGVESLSGGTRGFTTAVTGVLSGRNGAGLAAAEQFFRSYQDGLTYDFVDMFGQLWPEVECLSFEPQGRVRQSAQGVFFRAYQARFEHLLSPGAGSDANA